MREPTEAEIREHLERDLNDPEHIAALRRSYEDFLKGDFMSWRIAFLPLPNWMRRFISMVWDWPTRRKVRRMQSDRLAIDE